MPLTGFGLKGTLTATGAECTLSRVSVSSVVTVTVCTPDGKSRVNPVAVGNKGFMVSTDTLFKKNIVAAYLSRQ